MLTGVIEKLKLTKAERSRLAGLLLAEIADTDLSAVNGDSKEEMTENINVLRSLCSRVDCLGRTYRWPLDKKQFDKGFNG